MYPSPWRTIFSYPSITFVFFIFIFFTIVFTLYCLTSISTSSVSYGIFLPFTTSIHIISCVRIPTFITIWRINPSNVSSLYTGIFFSIINFWIENAIFCASIFWIKHSFIPIISCVLCAKTPTCTSPCLFSPTGNCALFL